MIPPWITTCTWVCNAPCISHHVPFLITDDKTTVFFLNKIQNMDDLAPSLLHQFLLFWPYPICKCEDHIPQGSNTSCVPHCFLKFIDMKGAFVLEHHNDPFFAWPQVQINMCDFRATEVPLDHSPFEQCHQGEKDITVVFHHIWSFMAIHIDSFLYLYVPPPQFA